MKNNKSNKFGFCCCRCGQEINYPYEFNGNIYGSECIKIVCPSKTKQKQKGIWINAESFYIEEKINGISVTAFVRHKIFGLKKLYDFYSSNRKAEKSILIQNDKAKVNLLAYDNLNLNYYYID